MRSLKSCITLLVGILLTCSSNYAGLDPSYSPKAVIDTVPFYSGGVYNESIPKPNDFLKNDIGQYPLRYHELDDYLHILAKASNRVKLEKHGDTYENRPLFNIFISSPKNLDKLDELRLAMNRLADPSLIVSNKEADSLAEVLPAVAWLGYSIHGDEVSGVDAAIQLIYQLAAGEDQATVRLLENLVIIIDPSENPDGRERYLSMLQTFKSSIPNYNQNAMQHQGVWPWGRGNHYLFDLNRDWILTRQPETIGKLATIIKWHPQLVVDAHEMGSNATYLFTPPRQPINYNTPNHYFKWGPIFAKDQANAFDKNGWPYYSGEWDEQWYPGYGSAWSTFFGAIGVLYEMAGVDGQFVKQKDDYILTYHEAVNKQFTSSLANLNTLADNRSKILKDYYLARKKIVDDGRRSGKVFLIKPGRDENKINTFIENLLNQEIEVSRATAGFTVSSSIDIYSRKHSSLTFPAGTYIISLAQPHGGLANAILDFDPHLKLEFLNEERREIEKYGDTRLYEVSTWSLPLAYDIDAYMTKSPIKVNREIVDHVTPKPGAVHNPDAQFGFVIDMVGEKTNHALIKLFQEELIIYASEKAFKVEGRNYFPGSLILRRRGNPAELAEILERIASDIGIDIYGVSTALSSVGSKLGAPTFKLLNPPKIGLLSGDGLNYTSFGSLWYMLDMELGIPHSLLNARHLDWVNLDVYNVLILPSSWGPFKNTIGESGSKQLDEWVKDGGTLICVGNSTTWATDTANGISQVRQKRQALDKLDRFQLGVKRERQAEKPVVDTMALWHPEKVNADTSEKSEKNPELQEAQTKDTWQRKFHPRGVIFNAVLDSEDWLSFGMKSSVPVMMYSDYAFMAKPSVKTVARLADKNDLRMSGLLWPEARERWANTAYLTRERKGKGQIILFADEPHLRAYFFGSRQLMVNAILYGPGMGSSFEGPYNRQQ